MQFRHLTFLGTSSGVPTLHRNVSSAVLTYTTGEQWMFDCGEGTQQQLLHCPGVSISKLTRLFITHLHGDHSYGLPGLLCSLSMFWTPDDGSAGPARAGKIKSPSPAAAAGETEEVEGPPTAFFPFRKGQEYLEIVGPAPLASFIRASLAFSDAYFPFRYRVSELLPPPELGPLPGHELCRDGLLHPCEAPPLRIPPENGVYRVPMGSLPVTVLAAPLTHRIFSLGYALTEESKPGTLDVAAAARLGIPKGPLLAQLKSGKSVTVVGTDGPVTVHPAQVVAPDVPGGTLLYLGDTCDSERAVAIGTGARVVVHECTFDDAQAALAIPRGHSTARMAGAFAARLQAERLVLTHFSARYFPRAKDPTHVLRLEGEAAEGAAAARVAGSGALEIQAVDDFSVVDLTRKRA